MRALFSVMDDYYLHLIFVPRRRTLRTLATAQISDPCIPSVPAGVR